MSEEPLYEVHPLDRDYTDDKQPKAKSRPIVSTKTTYDPKLRKAGAIGMAVGFAIVVLSAILLNTTRGNSAWESLLSSVNRMGSIVMLAGGVTIVVAYRIKQLRELIAVQPFGVAGEAEGNQLSDESIATANPSSSNVDKMDSPKMRASNSLVSLALCNVMFFLIGLGVIISESGILIYYVMMLFAAFAVTLASVHRGFLRAYGVAATVGIIMAAGGGFFLMSYGRTFMLSSMFAAILINAVLCAGYVYHFVPDGENPAE